MDGVIYEQSKQLSQKISNIENCYLLNKFAVSCKEEVRSSKLSMTLL